MPIPNNLDDVLGIIRGCFAAGTFTLPANAFGPGEIQNLINIYMEGDQLVLTGASYTNSPDYVTVTGTGSNQPFGSTNVNAVFAFDASKGGTTLRLLAIPQMGWTFAVSFPKLATTFLPELGFDFGTEESLARGFYLSSYDNQATQYVPAVQYGLYFRANLQLTGLLAQLNWLLNGAETLLVQGPINIHQGIPEMDLKAPSVLGNLALGYFVVPGVDFDITSQLVPSDDGSSQSASASALMSFSTIIRFQTNDTRVDIPVSAAFINRPTFLQFRANLNDAVYATLNELSSLMAGQNLASLLDGINLTDYVRLTDFVLQVDPSTQALISISLGIRTAQPYTLIQSGGYGNVITLEDISLIFTLRNPISNPTLGVIVLGEIDILDNARLDVTAVYPGYTFNARLAENTVLNLAQVVKYFVNTISPDALSDVPTINILFFELVAQPSTSYYTASVVVEDDWQIPLGPTSFSITDVNFSIEYNQSEVQAQIGGMLVIGDNLAIVTVNWQLPGDLTIQGVVPSIDLTALINTYASVPLGFTLPPIILTNTNLLIQRFQDGGYFLAFGTTVTSPNFGTLELEFGQTAGQTGVTVGFALPPNWKLTDLSNSFNIWLLKDLTFTAASLVISSFNNPYFSFRSLSSQPVMPQYSSGGIQAGMYLYANLTLDSSADSAFGTVSKLLAGNPSAGQTGINSLMVALSVPQDYTQTDFLARLNGAFTFIQTSDHTPIVVLNDLGLHVRPFDEYIDLYLQVTIYVMGAQLGLRGDILVDGPEVDIRLETTTPWVNPFGIRGLTLNNMAAEFRFGATIALGLEGQITLGTGSTAIVLTAAMEFNIEAEFLPDVFFVSESGRINFGAIIGSFVASKYVPSVLNSIVLYQFSFIIVANPAGWTDLLTGQHFGAGIGFSGMVSVCGLVAKFAIQVDYSTGIYANGQLDAPLHIGPVTIANATHWDQGPYITINSASSPYVNMSVALRIWELSTIQLQATLTNNAFFLSFDFTLTTVAAFGRMAVTAYIQNSSTFQFNAALAISINQIGPIKVGSKNLGTISTPITIAATFQLNIGPGARFGLSISASLAISGYRMALPDTAISATPTSLTSFSQLPDVFAHALAQNLWSIGSALFQDANALFQYVSRGFMRLTDDIGNILQNYLRLSLKDAAVYLKSVANFMEYDIDDVARLLKSGFNVIDKDLTLALKYANYAVEDIAQVIGDLYHKSAEAVAQVLKDAGYELGAIATALKNAFGYSAKEVAQFFKSAWNIADTVVNAALSAASYAANKIEDAMKDVYGWFKSAAQAVGHALNPHNW